MKNDKENLANCQSITENSEMAKKDKEKRIVKYEKAMPKNFTISQSVIAQKLKEIDKNSYNNTISDLQVGVKNDKSIKVKASTIHSLPDNIILSQPLTEMDKMVHDAVVSIFLTGKKSFTVQDVYRVCNNLNLIYVKNSTLEPYKESIKKLQFTEITIDATKQIQSFYPDVKQTLYKNYLLPLEEVEVMMQSGEKINGFAYLTTPPVFEYTSNIKQIVNVKVQLLTEGRFKNSDEIAIINYYLVRRIEAMKSNPQLSRKINYITLFNECFEVEYEKMQKKQKFRKREQVKNRLEYYRDREYIADFLEYKEGNEKKGIEIIFKKEEK